MQGHYQSVPDTTKKKKFPEPRKEPNQYKEPIGPVRETMGTKIKTAAVSGATAGANWLFPRVKQVAANARDDSGRRTSSGGNPLAMIAPPSYYRGMPGMGPERHEPVKHKRRKRRREPPDDEPAWTAHMGVPPEVRRWMM